ncbi:MAG: Uma2 family endonuclease [Bryobacteraceae bacterium]
METTTLIPVEEYLQTSYSPDCDYVDGEVLERNVGEHDHAWLQLRIGSYLLVTYGPKGFDVVVEQRVQVSPTRYRVPDVCLMRVEVPMEQIFRKPPLLVIEIMSPEDRFSTIQRKIRDYVAFGVPNIWVIDPKDRSAFFWTAEGPFESQDLILRTDGEIVLPLPEIFAQL